MRERFKLIFILFSGLFFFDGSAAISECAYEDCSLDKEIFLKIDKDSLKEFNPKIGDPIKKVKIKKNYSNITGLLNKEELRLDKLIANFFNEDSELISSNAKNLNLEIESDLQFNKNNVFYAEGNVIAYLSNGKIKADKIEYDKINKIFKAKGNLTFESGEQFISAEYFEFDNKNKSGFVEDAYGILDIPNLKKDLKIESFFSKKNSNSKTKIKVFKDSPTEINLLNSSNVRLSNKFKPNSFQLNFSEITKWRFKSERIEINSNSWSSKLIYFTNDPYNKPQFIIKSKNFKGEIIDKKTKLRSNSTSIVFDQKITIPVGRRTIQDDDALFRWGLGYEKDKKDGFFILRNFDPINIGNNTSINLQGNFSLNRFLSGKTSAFRAKDSATFSDNVEKNTKFSDLFGLNSDISIGIDEWNMNIKGSLNSLNFDNLYDSFSGELLLNKNLIRKDDSSLDLGFYSSFNDENIYSSYGTKLIASNSTSKGNLSIDKNIIFDVGNFNAKKLGNESELMSSERYGLNTSISYTYNLIDFNDNKKVYGPQYKYKPSKVDQGLSLNANLGYGIYDYGIGNSQSIISFKLGPSIILGDFEKDFLDFTSLTIMPELVSKTGESPFNFDDFNENARIKVDFQQQLFGPILMGVSSYFIVDASSDNNGKFVDDVYYLGISRRAYELGFYYDKKDEAISLDFKIFNFGYKNFSEKF